jgi:hypothetical protein
MRVAGYIWVTPKEVEMDDDKRGIEQQLSPSHWSTMINRCLLLLVLSFLLFAVNGWGAIYYVDQAGGNDSNPGTSPGNAWKTISKVNRSSFSAGDSILFKRGETWQEFMTMPSSGSAGSPITVGAYGTGALPVFYGGITIASGSWTANDPVSGVWSYTTYTRYAVWQDSVPLKHASSSSCTDGNWYYGSGKVYYKPTSGTLTDHVVELYVNGLNLNNKSFITVDGIYFTKCYYSISNQPSSVTLAHSSNITVKNCAFTNSLSGVAIRVDNTVSTTITVSNNTFDYVGQSVFVGGLGEDAELYPHNTDSVTISNNIISHCSQPYGAVGYDWSTASSVDYEGIGTQNLTNSSIYNNAISGNCRGIVFYTATGGTSYNNNIFSNSINTTRPGMMVITPSNTKTNLYNNRIYYNIIYGSASDDYAWYHAGVIIQDTTSTGTINKFYNNVINGGLSNLWFTGAGGVNNTYYWEVKNNIFSNPTNFNIGEYPTPAAGNVIYDYNLYYPVGSNSFYTGGATRNYTDWKSIGGRDAHSVTGDPKFISAGSDFHLLAGSPAINAGTNVGLAMDYAGTTVPQGSAPDIGAYEYISPISPNQPSPPSTIIVQ